MKFQCFLATLRREFKVVQPRKKVFRPTANRTLGKLFWYFHSKDLMWLLARVLSFTTRFLSLIKERIPKTSSLGTYILSNEPERNLRANLLQSSASVLRDFSLLMVGTSAGLISMLLAPEAVSLSCIQKPQKPAS